MRHRAFLVNCGRSAVSKNITLCMNEGYLQYFYLVHCKPHAIVLLFTRKSTAITLAKTILIFPVKARFLFNQNSNAVIFCLDKVFIKINFKSLAI